ncbi:hypothetical protein [Aeromicrobium sp. 179-A 4D2 NHS]|uniref:hypothetical protein n=1 Tax=Aeromicrobium sp. 179-A 4D2 NHS TaxID=3142375 RepID=UPI0039A1AB9D
MTQDRFKDTGKPLPKGATPGSFSPTELPESNKSIADTSEDPRGLPRTPDGRVDARKAIALGLVSNEFSATPFPDGPRTVSFYGHWDNSEIVVEGIRDGEVMDEREDRGHWDEGMFAHWVTGTSDADVAAQMVDEFEDCQHIRLADEDEMTPTDDHDEAKEHLPLDPEGQVDTAAAVEQGIIVGFSTKRFDDFTVKTLVGRFDGDDFVVEKTIDGTGFNRSAENDPYGYPGNGMSDADIAASVLDDNPFARIIFKDAND